MERRWSFFEVVTAFLNTVWMSIGFGGLNRLFLEACLFIGFSVCGMLMYRTLLIQHLLAFMKLNIYADLCELN